MDCRRIALSLVMLAVVGVFAQAAEVQNGSFEETYLREVNAPEVQAMVKTGWKLQSPLAWPEGWEGSSGVSGVNFAVVQDNPHSGKNCSLLWGPFGSSGYLSTQVKGLKKGIYKVSFQGRGKGRATLMFAGVHIVLSAEMTDNWAEYAGIYRNTIEPPLQEASLTLQAQRAEVFMDEVSVSECNVLEAALIEESTAMRREGKWFAADAVTETAVYRNYVTAVERAITNLKQYVEADPIPENVELIRLLDGKLAQLRQAVSPMAEQANEAAACARIAKRLEAELEFEVVKE